MLPAYVALVPFDDPSPVDRDRLLQVSAALQVQLVRDFGPHWGITGAVAPFAKLEHVPEGYLPLAIVARDLPLHRHGFHFSVAGLPFAVVQYCDGWPLAASHELMEMLVDPYGQRTILAPSVGDMKEEALQAPPPGAPSLVLDNGDPYTTQGSVNYLVEVCDACEHSTYVINGVLVSDFVLPHYYDLTGPSHPGYSFTGAVTSPLQVLDGGYLSWRTRLPGDVIYQAHAKPANAAKLQKNASASEPQPPADVAALAIEELSDGPLRLSVNAQRSTVSLPSGSSGSGAAAASAPPGATPGPPFGEAVHAAIEKLLEWLQVSTTSQQRPVSLDEIIGLVRRLAANDGNLWVDFQTNAELRDRELRKIGAPPHSPDRFKSVSRKDYQRVLAYLEEQKKVSGIFGPDLLDPGIALWMCMHIG